MGGGGSVMGSGEGGICGFKWGGGFVQARGVLVGGGCSGGGGMFRWGFSGGRGAKGQTLGGLKGSKGANVREGGEHSTEYFCNLSLGFEMD